jgi:Arc/MetJ-type ribon-helix-helix transcriptional regulator
MGRVQVNLKLDEKIIREMERLVEQGYFKTKTQAFKEAIQLLLKSCRAAELARQIDEIREGTEAAPSVTKAVVKAHEEEDEL